MVMMVMRRKLMRMLIMMIDYDYEDYHDDGNDDLVR
jgi:hypothetical protein